MSGGWAHPRVSGENATMAATARDLLGSSPRERGKRKFPPGDYYASRLIPA